MPPPEPEPAPEPEPSPNALRSGAGVAVRSGACRGRRLARVPRRRAEGRASPLVMMILFVLIVLAAVGYIFWQRSQLPTATPATAETNAVIAGPSRPGRTSRRTCRFSRAGSARAARQRDFRPPGGAARRRPAAIRSAPTAQGFAVGQIQPGESFPDLSAGRRLVARAHRLGRHRLCQGVGDRAARPATRRGADRDTRPAAIPDRPSAAPSRARRASASARRIAR